MKPTPLKYENKTIGPKRYEEKFNSELKIEDLELYTSMEVLDAKKVEYKDFIMHNKAKSRNMFSGLGSFFKTLFGGEIKGITKLTNNIRNVVVSELIQIAKSKGANAVIGLRVEMSSITAIIDCVAYGTAVYYTR